MHFMQFGETLNQAQIDGVTSIDEMIRICREFAEKHPERVRNGMHAIGWNQDLLRTATDFRTGMIWTRSVQNIL